MILPVIVCARRLGSSVPKLAPLPLHRKAGGITDLDPDAAQVGSVRAVNLLRHDALGAKPAGVREDDRTVLDDVFVEQDANLGVAQQPRQRGLALQKRTIAQILTVMLDQIEGIEDRCVCGLTTTQLLEPRQTVRPEHNRLAVDREALGFDPPCTVRNRTKSSGPIVCIAAV